MPPEAADIEADLRRVLQAANPEADPARAFYWYHIGDDVLREIERRHFVCLPESACSKRRCAEDFAAHIHDRAGKPKVNLRLARDRALRLHGVALLWGLLAGAIILSILCAVGRLAGTFGMATVALVAGALVLAVLKLVGWVHDVRQPWAANRHSLALAPAIEAAMQERR